MNRPPVCHHGARREQRARRLAHERHELVRKTRHRTADADASHVRTTADSTHPSTLAHVALHHRPPTAEFYDALARSVFVAEFRLLVVTAAVAALMDRLAEKRFWTQRLIES